MSSAFSDWMKEQQDGGRQAQKSDNSNWFSKSFQYVKQQTDIESSGLLSSVSSAGRAIVDFKDRLTTFLVLLGLSALFFLLAYFIGLPTLILRPAKFCISFIFGSIMGISSFAYLYGPSQYFKRMFTKERIFSTLIYFVSLVLCLFYALYSKSYVGTLASTIVHILVFVYFTLEAFPSGSYLTSALTKIVKHFFNLIWTIIKKCVC